MKNIKRFETEADVQNWQMGEEYVSPNVVLIGNQISYNLPSLLGVYIQHIDGSLYTIDQWDELGFTSDDANGVAVLSEKAKFVIAKQRTYGIKWANKTGFISGGLPQISDSATAKNDFDGKNNTEKIAAYDSSNAATYCIDYVFPNGKNGYLPALGELLVAYEQKDDIDSALSKLGLYNIPNKYLWSSTQQSTNTAWLVDWSTGGVMSASKLNNLNSYYAFPFTQL